MHLSRSALAGLTLFAPLLAAQTAGTTALPPGKVLLGLSAIQVVPAGALANEGLIGLGTDFQLLKGFGARRLFVGLDLRLGGVGPALRLMVRDTIPLRFDQKNRAQNSLTSIAVPVRYIFGHGGFRPYVSGSVGAAIWGIKMWDERSNESASLFPTTSHTHLELAEGVGFVALARDIAPTWYLDLGIRHVSSGTVDYLLRSGFASVNGRTVTETTPVSPQLFVLSLGVTALFH